MADVHRIGWLRVFGQKLHSAGNVFGVDEHTRLISGTPYFNRIVSLEDFVNERRNHVAHFGIKMIPRAVGIKGPDNDRFHFGLARVVFRKPLSHPFRPSVTPIGRLWFSPRAF